MVEQTKAATDIENSGYQVIKKRLNSQASQLLSSINTLNDNRKNAFGGTKREIIDRIKIETDIKCILRDAVQVQNMLMVGHNVQSVLSKNPRVGDIFSLYDVSNDNGKYRTVKKDLKGTFLDDPLFKKDFNELYNYYSDAQLSHILEQNGKLLVVYQVGSQVDDIKVFRWLIDRNGDLNYEDSRGDSDYSVSRQHDFSYREVLANHKNRAKGMITLDDRVFISLKGGELNIIIDDGSELGNTTLSEKVAEPTQTLEDCEVHVASIENILIAKVTPYREKTTRYYVINKIMHTAHRIDAVGVSCRSLPEGHGIIFPGGVYLSTDQLKTFESKIDGWRYQEMLSSPNGEDLMYVFYEPKEGEFILFGYNMVNRSVETPIYGHGFALFNDGAMFVFRSDDDAVDSEIHPIQIWSTSFFEDQKVETIDSDNPLASLGNHEIVRGLSDMNALLSNIQNKNPTRDVFIKISQMANKVIDTYYWVNDEGITDAAKYLKEISNTSETVIAEFDKVEKLRQDALKTLNETTKEGKKILLNARTERWETIESSMPVIHQLRDFRGHLLTIRDHNFIDKEAIDALNKEFQDAEEESGQKLLKALSSEDSFEVYHERISAVSSNIDNAGIDTLEEKITEINGIAKDLGTITEVLSEIEVNDSTIITSILEIVSSIYADLNQVRARVERDLESARELALTAQFQTQMTLLSQSVTHAINMSITVDDCNDQQGRLMSQIEEMESRFSQVEKFADAILDKRTELSNLFENKKQTIANAEQKEIQSAHTGALRLLDNLKSKAERIKQLDVLNGFFVSDPMVTRAKTVVEKLTAIGGITQAEDISSKLKGMKDELISSLKDKTDLLEDGGNIIRLGQNRFTVNHEALDLSIVNAGEDQLAFHLNGTNYYENITDERFNALRDFWNQDVISETSEVYRGEYLAYQVIFQALNSAGGVKKLVTSIKNDTIKEEVRTIATERYQDGYENGVHDSDAVEIVKTWASLNEGSSTLKQKAIYRLHAHNLIKEMNLQDGFKTADLIETAKMNQSLMDTLNVTEPMTQFKAQLIDMMHNLEIEEKNKPIIAETTVDALVNEDHPDAFNISSEGYALYEAVKTSLITINQYSRLMTSIATMNSWVDQFAVVNSIVNGYTASHDEKSSTYIMEEAAVAMMIESGVASTTDDGETQDISHVIVTREHQTETIIHGLIGVHNRINNGDLNFGLADFNERLSYHVQFVTEGFREFNNVRKTIAAEVKEELRVDEFKPKPLTSFVRNKLVNDVYLPIIGNNLAKQMGTAGDDRRSDLMGMLLLISPPGYGKTTLVEYVASRMGMVFMKINCPSLGHEVTSLDPEDANNIAAAQEIEKINLAFEMGNNVLLYLDDIQHTNPEFLQKFISLCDGTRRIEGVWKGKSQTYDMRGRKFAIMMAGNPYTESGDVFKIPDMLANRADIYNMGDMMSGQEEAFESSYIENCLTSNKTLAPLASRGLNDVYTIMDMAAGKESSSADLEFQYSVAELDEMQRVIKSLFRVRDVALKANMEYIKSASMKDSYRVEPPFKLQGSYRNMNKMAEKVVSIMNDEEIDQVILDHYRSESQTLTTGSEENLLKLKELIGVLTDEEKERWEQIKAEFVRQVSMGGEDQDSLSKIANQISYVNSSLGNIADTMTAEDNEVESDAIVTLIEQLKASSEQSQERTEKALEAFASKEVTLSVPDDKMKGKASEGVDEKLIIETLMDIIDTSLRPLLNSFENKFRMDQSMWESNIESIEMLRNLEKKLKNRGLIEEE